MLASFESIGFVSTDLVSEELLSVDFISILLVCLSFSDKSKSILFCRIARLSLLSPAVTDTSFILGAEILNNKPNLNAEPLLNKY